MESESLPDQDSLFPTAELDKFKPHAKWVWKSRSSVFKTKLTAYKLYDPGQVT